MNLIYNYISNPFLNFFVTDGISLVFFNVFVYLFLLSNMFGIFFLFDLRYLRTLNELKSCGNFFFISIFIIILLLSLAGVPPLLGFVGKFLLFIFLIKTSNWFIVIFFSLINFFIIYFYIQNIRFLVSKTSFFYFYFKNHYVYFNFNLIYMLTFCNTINLFGFFITDDLIIYFSYINSFLFLN